MNRTAPRLRFGPQQASVNASTLTAVIDHRFELMANYASCVRAATVDALRSPVISGDDTDLPSILRLAKPWLHRDADKIPPHAKLHVTRALLVSPSLTVLIEMREKLRRLWTATNVPKAQLVVDLQCWLHDAEQSGIGSLQEFALHLRSARE